jgi:hypothetical protein
LSSSVPEPKSINNLGLPDSNSKAMKSVTNNQRLTIKVITRNSRQNEDGQTWNESFLRFRWHHRSVVEQSSVRFLSEELDTEMGIFTHFQRRIPSPTTAAESAGSLLTTRSVVATWTLTSIGKTEIFKSKICQVWENQRTWHHNGLRRIFRHCGMDYCDSFHREWNYGHHKCTLAEYRSGRLRGPFCWHWSGTAKCWLP